VMKRAALYVRVSTLKKAAQANVETGERAYEQNPDMQLEQLERVALQSGWRITDYYTDRSSGAKESRPGLDALMSDARRRKFQVVLVWRFDRFARSVQQLVNALAEFKALGIDFVSTQEALDTSMPMGKAMFAIIGAMAELERDIIRERIAAGMAHAAKHGTKSGKPPGRPRKVFDRGRVMELRAMGVSWPGIAKELGVKASTIRRAYRELSE